ncbi:OmpA family protein [Paracoccus sp. S-4012]|uniref:OmpA family protein n=1 Tax=Paracoccus sp. S-4012 TaxID=2665648 RepID=UPI0012B13E29|nr:OmpA family protein [Paracoccus sp. S-4012]MRX49098.1 OmpA family protein [Paracoccus sp. S-4012]
MSRPPPRRRSRKGVATLAAAVLMAGAAGGAWFGAIEAADYIENRSAIEVRRALADGFPWASVATDGLQVALTGTAPDEGARLRALAAAGTAVDQGRIVERIEVARQAPVAPPAFKVELLRNDSGISMIGLVPAASDPAAIASTAGGSGRVPVADLLETADFPAPEGWAEALGFALEVVAGTPRAKISVAPGHVAVTALTDSAEEKARLEGALTSRAPEGVVLDLDISAPRPVISPFALRFVMDEAGARFDACAADTEAARDRILAAARQAGATASDCALGLGAPSPRWADAASAAISALAALGEGSVTLSDGDVALRAPATVPAAAFDEQAARLEHTLPDVFRLTTLRDAPAAEAPRPAEFVAVEDSSGRLTMRGRVPDEAMRDAVQSLARSRFASVDAALTVDPSVPEGWTVRVIAALEAMGDLATGAVEVTPALIRVQGVSGSRTASDAAATALAGRLGAGAAYALGIRYEPRLDPVLGLPDGAECAAAANEVLAVSEIGFEPNRPEIAGEVEPSLAALAEALEHCGDFRLEIGGHTDSRGSEEFNQRLSQQRAEAVRAAMAGAGITTTHMTVVGYGDSRPVASNETVAGREANRRIEFRLLSPEPVGGYPAAAASFVSGVTGGPAPESAGEAPVLVAAEAEALEEDDAPERHEPEPIAWPQTDADLDALRDDLGFADDPPASYTAGTSAIAAHVSPGPPD